MTQRGSTTSAEAAFAAVARAFEADPAVTAGTMFGSIALKAHGKVFAMIVKGSLVVKLPRAEVDALVANHVGTRFDPGHGKTMKEWLTVAGGPQQWLALAERAREFSAAAQASLKRRS